MMLGQCMLAVIASDMVNDYTASDGVYSNRIVSSGSNRSLAQCERICVTVNIAQ